jgi:hypothetical protein
MLRIKLDSYHHSWDYCQGSNLLLFPSIGTQSRSWYRCDTEKGRVEGSVMLSRTSEKYQYPPLCSLQGKIHHLTFARVGLSSAVTRLQARRSIAEFSCSTIFLLSHKCTNVPLHTFCCAQKHAAIDGNFIRSLRGLRENWNLSQIGRIHTIGSIVPAGPVSFSEHIGPPCATDLTHAGARVLP